MKKITLLVVTGIVIWLTALIPNIGVYISDSNANPIGVIDVPVGELVMLTGYLLVVKYRFKIKFNYQIRRLPAAVKPIFWRHYMILGLVGVSLNAIFSKSLTNLFQVIPTGQLGLAIFASFLGAAVVGLFEETMTRGGLFIALVGLFKATKRPILNAALLSSLLFGLLHLTNVSVQSVPDTIAQVIYATAFGFAMSMLYVKTGSLLLPVVVHAIVDWGDFFFNVSGEPTLTIRTGMGPLIILILSAMIGYQGYKSLNEVERKRMMDKI